MSPYLRRLASIAAASWLALPSSAAAAAPTGIVWQVSSRLPMFTQPEDEERYLATVRRINPAHSGDFSDKYAEASPVRRDQRLPVTRWDPRSERYDSASLLAPVTIDARLVGAAAGDRCSWSLDGRPVEGGEACELSHLVVPPEPASSRLSVVVDDAAGSIRRAVVEVAPRRTVIVALGDSYASGEGVPDRARGRDDAAGWWDRRCHRSLFGAPALAAAALAEEDPHRSVVFLSFACSGARLPELLTQIGSEPLEKGERDLLGQEPPDEIRALFRQRFPNRPLPPVPARPDLLPQVQAAAEALCLGTYDLGRRRCSGSMVRPEFVTLSIGGNDLRFVDLLEEMLTDRLSERDTAGWISRLGRAREVLARRLAMLAAEIDHILSPNLVLLTEYPDPLRNEGEALDRPGGLCDDWANWVYNWRRLRIVRPTLGLRITRVSAAESEFAIESFLEPLNSRLADSARDHQDRGWRMVRGIARAAGRFGYCSQFSHFRTAQQAQQQQGPQSWLQGWLAVSLGTGHPNMQGQLLYGCMIAARINALERGELWQAPLPWPKVCRDNRWDALLEDNEWIGPDGRPPAVGAEAARTARR